MSGVVPARDGYTTEELLATVMARLTAGLGHIAVGALSPLPASAALLAREMSSGTEITILGSPRHMRFTDGGRELFDCAAQGRVDAFFLSGGQIDGQANINLVAIGDYHKPKRRFPGSFGSAYLYHLVPKVILFRQEHSPRVFVEHVDFVSAAGTSPRHIYRPGGPKHLVTEMAVMDFEAAAGRFRLATVQPGYTERELRDNTGFHYALPEEIRTTPAPTREELELLRGIVREEVAHAYPKFAREAFLAS